MERRDFIRSAGLGALALNASPTPPPQAEARRALMKLGTQQASPTDDMLRYFAQFGVRNICGTPPRPGLQGWWEVEDLLVLRRRVEFFGIRLDMLPLPMSSWPLSRSESPNIMLGKSPGRDREIEIVCRNIRAAAQAGIPCLKYNLTMLGVVRTARTPGRGGSSCSTFDYEKANKDELTEAGRVSPDQVWERIAYFLDRVVPVAEEHKVRLACHPNDPRVPDGFRGVSCVLGSVEGLKKFLEIRPSPYHGLNFCQGTICEGLENPAKEIFGVLCRLRGYVYFQVSILSWLYFIIPAFIYFSFLFIHMRKITWWEKGL